MSDSGDITRLLVELRGGSREAQSRLLDAVYPELKKIAARHLSKERAAHTLQPTALVNEAYLQMLGAGEVDWRDRSHFFGIAATAMRRILVDYARRRKSAKRDGALHKIELTDGLAISDDRLEELVVIDEALTRLATWDARQSSVVELRFFGGLSEEEVAGVLGIAIRTVKRDWQIARAWLHGQLTRGAGA